LRRLRPSSVVVALRIVLVPGWKACSRQSREQGSAEISKQVGGCIGALLGQDSSRTTE
jgi:hypothetical protein